MGFGHPVSVPGLIQILEEELGIPAQVVSFRFALRRAERCTWNIGEVTVSSCDDCASVALLHVY